MIWVNRDHSSIRQLEISLKLVKMLIGALTVDLRSIELTETGLFVFGHPQDGRVRLLMFEICLSIKILRLNVRDALG